jgi:ferredoxin
MGVLGRPRFSDIFESGMPHFITETCIGCGVCEIKCPTHTITGDKAEKYVIHADRCIDEDAG